MAEQLKYVCKILERCGTETSPTGTGFFISGEGHIATCSHVIKDDREYYVQLPYSEPWLCQVAGRLKDHDLAVLQPVLQPGIQVVTADLYDGEGLGVVEGDPVTFWGCSAGNLSAAAEAVHCTIASFDLTRARLALSGSINPGDSGGPVLSREGKVVGLIWARDTKREGHGLAIPVSLLRRLCNERGIRLGTRALDKHQLRPLPVSLTEFVGRRRDLDTIGSFFDKGKRIVSLVGPGGIGKTRLAIEFARRRTRQSGAVVCFVDLTQCKTAAQLHSAVFAALRAQPEGDEDVLDALARLLTRARVSLLLLDNLERVLRRQQEKRDVVGLLRGISMSCETLSCLITTREALGIEGEQVFTVPSMLSEHSVRSGDPARDAVQLFLNRASEVNPNINREDRGVVDIVRRIVHAAEGIPLAMLLVASLAAEQPLSRLAAQVEPAWFIRSHIGLEQNALQEAIKVSVEGLSEIEKEVFARISVFRGGFSVEAAVRVCARTTPWDHHTLATAVMSLRRKSLLGTRDYRYLMLETIRESAKELLHNQSASVRDAVAVAHAEYFLELVSTRFNRFELDGNWRPLEDEKYNIQSAINWATADRPGLASNLCIAYCPFLAFRGYFHEQYEWAQRAVDCAGRAADPDQVAEAYHHLGWSLQDLCRFDAAESSYRKSLNLRQEARKPNERGIGETLNNLAVLHNDRGDLEQARAYEAQYLQIATEVINDVFVQIRALSNMGWIAYQQAREETDPVMARKYLDESVRAHLKSLRLCRMHGINSGVGRSLNNLGLVAELRGDIWKAKRLYWQGLIQLRASGAERDFPECLRNLSSAMYKDGCHVTALSMARRSHQLCEVLGYRVGIAKVHSLMCSLYASTNDHAIAEREGEAAIHLWQEVKLDAPQIVDLCKLAAIAKSREAPTVAAKRLRQARALARKCRKSIQQVLRLVRAGSILRTF